MTVNSEILNNVLDHIIQGVVMFDAGRRLVVWNGQYEKVLRYPDGFLRAGLAHHEMTLFLAERGDFGPGDPETLAAERIDLLWSGGLNSSEITVEGEDTCEVLFRPTNEGGLVVTYTDITEHKRSERALEHRTELVQLLSRTATDANQASEFSGALRATLADICAYNGWPVGHAYILADDDADLLVPARIWHLEDSQRFATFRKVTEETTFKKGIGLPGRVLASGEPAWIVDVTKDPNFPRAQLADDIGVKAGFACPVLVGSTVVAVLEFFAPEAVEPDRMLLDSLVHVGTQLGRVYEREQAEMHLRKSRDDLAQQTDVLETVLESMPEGVVAFDKDLKLLVWNQNFLDIRGFPSELVQANQAFGDFMRYDADRQEFGDDDPEEVVQQQIDRAKKFLPHAFERRRPNGRFISVQGGPLKGGGFVSTYTDVTARKQADEQIRAQRDQLEKLNQEKNRLFSIIAHDLKNPFTSLLGLSQAMAQLSHKLTPEQVIDYARSINESGQRVFGLLENLLEWSLSQMDQVAFEPQPRDLKQLVEHSMDLLSKTADEKGVRLLSTVPSVSVDVDSNMVNTVIRNLLGNAIKFTDEAGRVAIGAQANDAWVEVTVTDSGVGMPADQIEALFALGSTQSTTGTTGETGTGLGLVLCKDFIERHGGTLRAESEIGKGSTFAFTLPIHRTAGRARQS